MFSNDPKHLLMVSSSSKCSQFFLKWFQMVINDPKCFQWSQVVLNGLRWFLIVSNGLDFFLQTVSNGPNENYGTLCILFYIESWNSHYKAYMGRFPQDRNFACFVSLLPLLRYFHCFSWRNWKKWKYIKSGSREIQVFDIAKIFPMCVLERERPGPSKSGFIFCVS